MDDATESDHEGGSQEDQEPAKEEENKEDKPPEETDAGLSLQDRQILDL